MIGLSNGTQRKLRIAEGRRILVPDVRDRQCRPKKHHRKQALLRSLLKHSGRQMKNFSMTLTGMEGSPVQSSNLIKPAVISRSATSGRWRCCSAAVWRCRVAVTVHTICGFRVARAAPRNDRCYRPTMPLDPKQRHKLLMADRTGDAGWITAVIEKLLTADPTVTLDEIEEVLRAAAGTAYLVGTAKGFEVVIGFTAWRDVLAEAGVTAEANRQALADRAVTA